jgi:hypothetical protein
VEEAKLLKVTYILIVIVKKEQGDGFKRMKIYLQIYDELFNCGSKIRITRKRDI